MIGETTFGSYNILHPYMGFIGPVFAAKATKKLDEPVGTIVKEGLEGLNQKGLSATFNDLVKAKEEQRWSEYSNFDARCPLLAENIKKVDVVCLQEISSDAIQKIIDCTGYKLAKASYHTSDAPEKVFGNAILFNPNTVRMKGDFEISHKGSKVTRQAACAVLESGGKVYKVASVHLEGYWSKNPDLVKKQESKKIGHEELQMYVAGVESEPTDADAIVIGGDFNEGAEERDADLYRPGFLKDRKYSFDGSLAPTEPTTNRRIDWIFIKARAGNDFVRLESMNLENNQHNVSDHLMTGTTVRWV